MLNDLHRARRLLVVTKFKYLGDTIVATPFLHQLASAVPEAEITLLSGPAMPVLLEGCPYLREVLPFDTKGSERILKNLTLVRKLQETPYDAVFLLNRSIHSAILAAIAGIPLRIGFNTEYRGPLLTHRVRYDWNKPDRECALDLLRAIGIDAQPELPQLWVSEAERQAAQTTLDARGVGPEDLLVGIQPGAHDPEVREWGAERFAEVADRLVESHAARIVLLGSADERPVAERVLAAMSHRERANVLAGETSLREALAVLSRCRLWIGNDGGMLHAAVALGPATVGIFGPTKARRWGYDTSRHKTVVHYPATPARDAAAIRHCLDAITPEEVYRAAVSVLEIRSVEEQR